jgi:hypothetical protein
MPLEDYWDKPRTITVRQLAAALAVVDGFHDPEYWQTHEGQLKWAAAIIAAIPETAEDSE